jgi:IS30 family transposase
MAKGYHHVTRDIRSQIYAYKASGWSMQRMAKKLGFHVSTISREIERNSGKRGYRLNQADSKAVERRRAASMRVYKMTPGVIEKIEEKIKLDWSPEQISGRFKKEGIFISHESIYIMIWADKKSGGELYKYLRHRGKYHKRSSGKAGRGCIPGRVDISERPKIVERKSRIGDWEGDTIIGAKNQGTILSLVDRCSKFTQLKSIERKNSSLVFKAIVEKMSALPHPVHTITFDNGKEFAQHENIAIALNALCYFATPYHAWERGLNEHTNGLVRQYLPKSTDLSKVSDELLERIEELLNHRPRKVLDYKTPFEVFFRNPRFRKSPLSHA